MKSWKQIVAIVLSIAMVLSTSTTVLAQGSLNKKENAMAATSTSEDEICINGKYYTKAQFIELLATAKKNGNNSNV